MKNIILFLLLFAAGSNAQTSVKISPSSESYIDPEILDGENLLTFQTPSGNVWIGKLDPLSGLFESKSGKDFFVDSFAVHPSQTLNGPEFGFDKTSWVTVYTKALDGVPQVWLAHDVGSKFEKRAITSGLMRRQTALASKNPDAASVRMVYAIGSLNGLMAWTDEDVPGSETVIDSVDRGIRWVNSSNQLVYVKQSGANKGELVIYDTDTKSETIITNDGRIKSHPYGWFAPELQGELAVLAMLDGDTKIGVYKKTEGQFWQVFRTINLPDSSKYEYFGSPEPFTAAGKSFISCVIKEKANAYSNSEVWVFGLDQGVNTSFELRIKDGQGETQRTDPESFIGKNQVFIFYNIKTNHGVFEAYRASTGIVTLKDKDLAYHTIFPNETDTNIIDGNPEPHYALYNTNKQKQLNKLLLYFPGTTARPYDYLKFSKTAVELGYHAISLSYENQYSINYIACHRTTDTTCHRRARHEIWFGEDSHEILNVSEPNSIINRITKLLEFLSYKFPKEDWSATGEKPPIANINDTASSLNHDVLFIDLIKI